MPATPDDLTHSVAPDPDRDATWDAPPAARPTVAREVAGTVVGGRYTLIECVGEGGMGQVWSAQQTSPVKRRVAVKLVKAGMDSKAVLARFEAERQALAVMDHPNIARILDGGLTDSGAPFFVMELVHGVPITEYCDRHKLTPARRLELFVPVCEAIQHAHQKGVIHRDIKPSNVLVAETDAGPVPKVIDFGLAKATHEPLTDLTFRTRVGGLLGTPHYMSPEQASLSGTDIDTRSDVYSLGVLLYELLAGSPPFLRKDLERASVYEVLRVIRDEEPPKPSTKLSSADTLPSLSASRGTDPKALAKLLRSELDWVVMKALEKDRIRRYDSATAFAADVRRYLAGEAVQAHPPSTAYRLRKFLRKNRGPVAAATLVALALVAGVVGTSVGQVRAERARTLAETRREQAEAAEALAETRLGEAEVATALAEKRRGEAGVATTLAEKRRGEAEKSRKRTMATLRATTGEDIEKLIGSRAELGANERAYLEAIIGRWNSFASDTIQTESIVAANGKVYLQTRITPEGRSIMAEGELSVASIRYKLGGRDAAIEGYCRGFAILNSLATEFPAVPEYKHELARSRNNLGFMLNDQGKSIEAEAEYRAALALLGKLAADFPAVPEYRSDLATSRNHLGVLLSAQGKVTEAEAEHRAALAIRQKLVANFPSYGNYREPLSDSYSNLGTLLINCGKLPEAEAQHRATLAICEKLVTEFPTVPEYRCKLAGSRNNLGLVLVGQGKWPGAEAEYRAALAIQEKLAADYPAVPDYRINLGGGYCNFGNLVCDDGKSAESLPWYDKAVSTLTQVVHQQPDATTARQFLLNSHLGRARAYDASKRHLEANVDWNRLIELSTAKEQPIYRMSRAISRVQAGQHAEAVAEVAELAESDAWDDRQWFVSVCVYAVASGKVAGMREEYAGRAVELLRKAVAKGFKDSGSVATDADLDPLRGRADFRKLVAELEAKHPRPLELAPPPRPAK